MNENKYLTFLVEREADERARQRSALADSVAVQPDTFAAQRRDAATLGVAPGVIAADPSAARDAKVARIEADIADAPALGKMILRPEFAKLAHDDVPALKDVEGWVANMAREVAGTTARGKSVLQSVPAGVARRSAGLYGFATNAADAAAPLLDPLTTAFGANNPLRQLSEFTRYGYTVAQQTADRIAPQIERSSRDDTIIGRAMQSAAESIGQTLVGLPAGVLAAGTSAAQAPLIGMAVATGGNSAMEARDKEGLDPVRALYVGAADAVAEFGGEKVAFGRLVQDTIRGTGIFKTAARQLVPEVLGENATTALQDFNAWALLPSNANKTLGDYIAERPAAAAETTLATLFGVGGNAALSRAVGMSAERLLTQKRDAMIAVEDTDKLVKLLQAAAQSKLRERDPDSFAQLVQQAAEEHPGVPARVYVDAAVLVGDGGQAGIVSRDELLQLAPSVTEQELNEALATGGAVELPLGEVAARVAGTPLEQSLIEHVRTTPEGLSRAEAKQVDQQVADLGKLAQAAVEQASDAVVAEGEREQVRQKVASQLQAAGRFTGDVNEVYARITADFFTTMAKRVGLTPATLYARYPLRVTGAPIEGLEQGGGWFTGSLQRGLTRLSASAARDGNLFGPGVYAARDRDYAATYARAPLNADGSRGEGGSIYSTEFKPTKPFDIADADNARRYKELADTVGKDKANATLAAEGYDAIFFKGSRGEPLAVFLNDVDVTEDTSTNTAPTAPNFDTSGLALAQSVRTGPNVHQDVARELLESSPVPQRSTVRIMRNAALAPLLSTNFDIARYFTRKNADALGEWGTASARRKLVSVLRSEVLYALSRDGSAVGWYDRKVKAALRMLEQMHPELATNDEARFGFIVMLAITSNSTTVNENFDHAEYLYSQWKETGAWPSDKVRSNKAAKAMREHMAVVGRMIHSDGWQRTRDFLAEEHPVRDIVARTGLDVPAELKDARVRGAIALGSKIGTFFNNLYGNYDSVTMDRWFMRTINRHRGTMLKLPESFSAQVERLRNVADSVEVREEIDAFLAAPAKNHEAALEALPETLEYVRGVMKEYSRGFKNRNAINVNSKIVYEALTLDEQTPNGGADRQELRLVMRDLQRSLANDGIQIEIADLQAVLWYYEKDLFNLLKRKKGSTDAEDYETAARRLLRVRGIAGAEAADGISGRQGNLFQSVPGGAGQRGRSQQPDRLIGLPATVKVDGQDVTFGPFHPAHDAASQYMADAGLDYTPPRVYAKVDAERAKRIAAAFDAMPHNPSDPDVLASYNAMIRETMEQYRAILATGLKVEFNDGADPYGNPRNAILDVVRNNHLYVFSTREGFGSDASFDPRDNPLLAETEFTDANGAPMLANDVFRVVHDYFGHIKDGVGFRADGEENAWRSHAAMYSPLARKAMTTETRGQNSWVNFGPFAGANRTASGGETRYADQKIGLLPDWAVEDGRTDPQELLPTPSSAAQDADGGVSLAQSARGTFSPSQLQISLLEQADLSTFLHELGHFGLEVMADLAAKPGAPANVAEDMAAILRWFGVKAGDKRTALETWRAMSLDEKRPFHEKFAEGFEQYLFEGKAPTQDLQPAFAKIRSWMTAVYRSLKQFLNGKDKTLTPSVRGVFDRMLASEDAIAEAQQIEAYQPLFNDAAAAGMEPEQFERYLALGQQATDNAISALAARSLRDMKWVAGARARALADEQKRVEALRRQTEAQVRAELEATPVERARAAIRVLQKEELKVNARAKEQRAQWTAAYKVAEAEAREAHKEAPAEERKLRVQQAMLQWELDNPAPKPALPEGKLQLIAESAGFRGVDEMQQMLDRSPAIEQELEGLVDRRLLEQYGDTVTAAGMRRAADEAVHNEARSRFIATGLKVLVDGSRQSERQPGQKVSANVLLRAAKQYAAKIVGDRTIRSLSVQKFKAAEARAGKAALESIAAGDERRAIAETRGQMLNNQLVRTAYATLEEVERGVKYLRSAPDAAGIDPSYREQIEALLERFDLKEVSGKRAERRKSLAAWVAEQRELGVEPDLSADVMAETFLLPYRDMTVDQFRGLVASVRQIEHLGRLKNKLLTAKEQREFESARDEIASSITANAGKRKADTRTPTTNFGRALQGIKRFGAAHIKAATWARIFDGGKDGGPVWEYIIRPANERADYETTMRAKATKDLSAILAPWLKGGNLGVRGKYFATIDRELNRESVLAIALNTGNDGNLQRLLGGEGWTMEQIQPVLATLTREDWRVVQQMWDYFDSFRPEIAAKQKRVYGTEPDWVAPTARTHTLADGATVEVRGGYYPIKYDPAASIRAEENADAEGAKRQLQGAYGAATTRRSFTKTRVEEVKGRPLLYTLSGIYSGVNDVIHDLAWHEWLIDVNRLLRSEAVDTAIRSHYGPEAMRQMKSWRDAIAEGDGGSHEALDQALGYLRQSVTVAGLGWNVMSAAMQPLGYVQSVQRIGAKWMGIGLKHYLANPVRAARTAQAASEFMRNRDRTRMRELNELRNRVQGASGVRQAIQENAYLLMMKVQATVDVPTWLGAYEKAIAGGSTEQRAVALADQAVRDSQGGGQINDLSAIERGGPAQKLFTTFYAYMNAALNLGVAAKMTPGSKIKFAVDMLLLYTVPAVLGGFIRDALTPGEAGDDDDGESLARKLIAAQVEYLMSLMVLVREFAQVGKFIAGEDTLRGYEGPAGLRIIVETGRAAQQIAQGEADEALRKSLVNMAGYTTGVPSAQINRTITGAEALSEGKTENPAALLFGYQEPD